MKLREQIRGVLACAGIIVALMAVPVLAQKHGQDSRPPAPPRNESHTQSRPETRPQASQQRPQFQPSPRDNARENRRYEPPAQGHHSGQWLNQHRDMTPDQQRRALANDPQFRHLSPERQQRLEQRLQRFDSMPPERQQQVLRRMETWEHLTPQQKQDFNGVRTQFNGLAPDRRQAVRNAIESLRAMPPAAREREIDSGRFSQFSPQERQILSGASRLPLAPAENEGTQPAPPNSGQQRYIPRPPQ